MWLKFTKMHSHGNDVIVIDLITQEGCVRPDRLAELAHRTLGIGGNQVLFIEQPDNPEVDFSYQLFDAQGRTIANNDSAARCLAHYVASQQLTGKRQLRLGLKSEQTVVEFVGENHISYEQNQPELIKHNIELIADRSKENLNDLIQNSMLFSCANNEHFLVLRVDSLEKNNLHEPKRFLSKNTRLPLGTQLVFMQIVHEQNIKLRTFNERGKEVFCSGQAAAAALAAGIKKYNLDRKVTVALHKTQLELQWLGNKIKTIGDAHIVFDGRVNI